MSPASGKYVRASGGCHGDGVEGDFRRGDVIEVVSGTGAEPLARGLAQYGADEIRRIARRHSNDIEAVLGFRYGESVIHRDDLVLLEAPE